MAASLDSPPLRFLIVSVGGDKAGPESVGNWKKVYGKNRGKENEAEDFSKGEENTVSLRWDKVHGIVTRTVLKIT